MGANDRFLPFTQEANKAELFNYLIINYSVLFLLKCVSIQVSAIDYQS